MAEWNERCGENGAHDSFGALQLGAQLGEHGKIQRKLGSSFDHRREARVESDSGARPPVVCGEENAISTVLYVCRRLMLWGGTAVGVCVCVVKKLRCSATVTRVVGHTALFGLP